MILGGLAQTPDVRVTVMPEAEWKVVRERKAAAPKHLKIRRKVSCPGPEAKGPAVV